MLHQRLARIEQRLSLMDGVLLGLDSQVCNLAARVEQLLLLVHQDLAIDTLSAVQEDQIMTDLSTLVSEVQANGDAVDSAVVLLTRLADELEAAGTDQAAIDEVVSQLRGNSQELADAVVANTPAAPDAPVDEEPPVDVPPADGEPV